MRVSVRYAVGGDDPGKHSNATGEIPQAPGDSLKTRMIVDDGHPQGGRRKRMISNAASAGLAGFEAASRRLEASAHNIANVNTRNFHPVEIQQAVDASERPQTVASRSPEPGEVDLAREAVEQTKALVGGQAALRTLDAELELKGSLLDIKV